MNCSLNTVAGLITAAIAALLSAIALAYLWITALPLFAAAALVASVAFYSFPRSSRRCSTMLRVVARQTNVGCP